MSKIPNPYVGPRSFETGEKLYGRDREVRALSALLIAERIVLLHSPSGAGKTSLLKAGLLPNLREENFNVLPIVRVNITLPPEATNANRYLLSTLISLEEGFSQAERLSLADLMQLSLDDYLLKRAPEKDTLLVFDQFEEVLTISSADLDGKLAFFNQLGSALRNKNRWALFSMREDYLGMLSPYVRPIPNRLVTRYRLDLLSSEAAIQAMQMPSKAMGIDFSTSAAQQLADDLRRIQVMLPDGNLEAQLGPYVEPVQLQVVCFRLWESLGEGNLEINEQDLANIGDVDQALANFYAQTIMTVSSAGGTPERSLREWFDRKLITPEGLRGQVRLGAGSSEGIPNTDVRQLENAHLIRTDQHAGQTWVELAHDRLVEPVRTNNSKWFMNNLSLFQRQAELWVEKDQPDSLLLRGKDLEVAEQEIDSNKLTQDETNYLRACRLLRKRMRRERMLRQGMTIGLVLSTVLFLVAVYFGFNASNANLRSVSAARTAEAASTQAIIERSNAQAASTQAIQQQNAAQAASTQAIAQQSTARAAESMAEKEKARALEQELIAQEQKKQAQANAVMVQSLLQEIKTKYALSSLLAVASFQISDMTRTRVQMLAPVYNRGKLFITQTKKVGITPNIGFLDGNTTIAASNFFGCENNNYYLCNSGEIDFIGITPDPPIVALKLENNPLQPPGLLDAMAMNPDGKSLASAACEPDKNKKRRCLKEKIQLWDIHSRQENGQSVSYSGEIAMDKKVLLAFSPNGKILALAINIPTVFSPSSDPSPALIIWDVETSTQKGIIAPGKGFTQMAFSQDNTSLALASGQEVLLLDLATMLTKTIEDARQTSAVLSLAYSPDNKYLAIGGDDGRITLLDLTTNQVTGQPLTQNSKVMALAFSPDSNILAAGYLDAGLLLWDVPGRQRLIPQPMYKHVEQMDKFPIYSLAFSPDGKMLVSGSDEIILWDMDPNSWAAKACFIAGRNFTKSEWKLYFPDEEYKTTCPQFPEGGQ